VLLRPRPTKNYWVHGLEVRWICEQSDLHGKLLWAGSTVESSSQVVLDVTCADLSYFCGRDRSLEFSEDV
jgi:hypothetical protein